MFFLQTLQKVRNVLCQKSCPPPKWPSLNVCHCSAVSRSTFLCLTKNKGRFKILQLHTYQWVIVVMKITFVQSKPSLFVPFASSWTGLTEKTFFGEVIMQNTLQLERNYGEFVTQFIIHWIVNGFTTTCQNFAWRKHLELICTFKREKLIWSISSHSMSSPFVCNSHSERKYG